MNLLTGSTKISCKFVSVSIHISISPCSYCYCYMYMYTHWHGKFIMLTTLSLLEVLINFNGTLTIKRVITSGPSAISPRDTKRNDDNILKLKRFCDFTIALLLRCASTGRLVHISTLCFHCITVASHERHGVSNHMLLDCLFNSLP